jgi:4'-phosphopantetheinyl transferase EntD
MAGSSAARTLPAVGMNAVIEKLVPGAACAELFGDAPESALLPAEAALVARAVAARQREFGSVRHCARTAMRRLGVPAAAILPDADGAPGWPDGVIGSMTHCGGYRAAVVARAGELRGVGIDAEPHAALPADVRDLVLADDDVDAGVDAHGDRVVFCAKEAGLQGVVPAHAALARLRRRGDGGARGRHVRRARRR